jgi:hypothetical protein
MLEEDEHDKVESVVDLIPAVTLPCHVFTAAIAGVAEDLVYLFAEQNLALLQDLKCTPCPICTRASALYAHTYLVSTLF